MTTDSPCLCITCSRERQTTDMASLLKHDLRHFRYACEICGNKRCPHHTDHRLACTNSNEPGQKGSIWE